MVDDCCYLEIQPALKNAMRNTVILKAPDIFIEKERALAQKKFAWNPDDSIFNSKRRNNQTRCSVCMLQNKNQIPGYLHTLCVQYRANYPFAL